MFKAIGSALVSVFKRKPPVAVAKPDAIASQTPEPADVEAVEEIEDAPPTLADEINQLLSEISTVETKPVSDPAAAAAQKTLVGRIGECEARLNSHAEVIGKVKDLGEAAAKALANDEQATALLKGMLARIDTIEKDVKANADNIKELRKNVFGE